MNPIESKEQPSRSFVRYPLSPKENRVIHFYSKATPLNWEDWKWQLKNRIQTKKDLSKFVNLTMEEIQGIEGCGKKLKFAIPPYFASLLDPDDPHCPIRMQAIPRGAELKSASDEMMDPCGEDKYSPIKGLVHRYPDRVLFLVSDACAMYCRHCTRSRIVGKESKALGKDSYQAAYDYIRANKQIRDVLISGGDPFMLADDVLEDILKKIKEIPHVEFVRIGTRTPVTLPQRITTNLVDMLKQYNPLWVSIHFNHVKEITKRVKFACDLLADSGIPLGSQTVLLKGINDTPEAMRELMHALLKIRVKPYYIYQCDPILGSKHFRASVSKGIQIIESLRGHTSGYAVPTYVIDGPGGGGKIPIEPNYIVSHKKGEYILRNYAGKKFVYQDPQP